MSHANTLQVIRRSHKTEIVAFDAKGRQCIKILIDARKINKIQRTLNNLIAQGFVQKQIFV